MASQSSRDFSDRVFPQTQIKYDLRLLLFLKSFGVLWTENIWCIFWVKPRFSNSFGLVWTWAKHIPWKWNQGIFLLVIQVQDWFSKKRVSCDDEWEAATQNWIPVPRKLRPDSYAGFGCRYDKSQEEGFWFIYCPFCLFPLCTQVGSFHAVGHLILEEIPIHDVNNSNSPDVRDVTAMQIELKAVSKVRHEVKMNNSLTDWLAKGQTDCWSDLLTDWRTEWLTYRQTDRQRQREWLANTDWLIDWLKGRQTVRVIYSLTDGPSD